jgi:hypothetical protein
VSAKLSELFGFGDNAGIFANQHSAARSGDNFVAPSASAASSINGIWYLLQAVRMG